MAKNKVVFGGETIIDLTEDTVTPETLLQGATAHNRSGEPIEGAVVVSPVDTEMSDTSENAVQNKVIKAYVDAQDAATLAAAKSYADVLGSSSFVLVPGTTTFDEIIDAVQSRKSLWMFHSEKRSISPVIFGYHYLSSNRLTICVLFNAGQYLEYDISAPSGGAALASFTPTKTIRMVENTASATDDALGLVKTKSADGISLDANGNLVISGRLGESAQGGLYSPPSANPTAVGAYSLLQTDAVGLSINNRTYGIMGGNNVTLKGSHAAGTTEYHVANNYANRIAAMSFKGGRATLNNSTAPQWTVRILSVKFADGSNIIPYSGTDNTKGDIVITTDGSANPDGATSAIRVYGTSTGTDVLNIGQCNGGTGGKVSAVGMHLCAEGNQVMLFGNTCYSNANNSVVMGRSNINTQQVGVLLGEGHDSSNGSQGVAAVGRYSDISSDTAFAVGIGTSDTARKNAFEVKNDGTIIGSSLVLKSPNGTLYKITVADDGTLSTSAV